MEYNTFINIKLKTVCAQKGNLVECVDERKSTKIRGLAKWATVSSGLPAYQNVASGNSYLCQSIIIINTKNCSLYIVLKATDQKPQKY